MQNKEDMETTVKMKRPTSVRFSENVMARIQAAAIKEHRSVSNWIEMAVLTFLNAQDALRPNETTVAALEEAKELQQAYREGKLAPEPVDLTSVESMLKSFGV